MPYDCCTSKDSFFIPPPGLAFRLLGYASHKVIYSRTHRQPEVGLHSAAEVYSDQWFTVLYGTGVSAGLYAFKSRHTGRVLFSRTHQKPRVGHISGDGAYRDNWFKFEPGEGRYSGYFRLVTPSQGLALVSRTHAGPYFFNHPVTEVFADQYFCFLFEDVQIDGIDYDVNAGQTVSSKPIVFAEQSLVNKTSLEQQMSLVVNHSVSSTSTHEFGTGFAIQIGTEITAAIPVISQGKFTISASTAQEWKWGETTSITQSFNTTFPIRAGPGQTVRAVSVANQGTLEVPFRVRLSSKSTGVKVETNGLWHGLATWDLRHSIEMVEKCG